MALVLDSCELVRIAFIRKHTFEKPKTFQRMWNLIYPFLTSSVQQVVSSSSQYRCPEIHEEQMFWLICFFCNGFWDHQLEVLNALKANYTIQTIKTTTKWRFQLGLNLATTMQHAISDDFRFFSYDASE